MDWTLLSAVGVCEAAEKRHQIGSEGLNALKPILFTKEKWNEIDRNRKNVNRNIDT